MKTPTIRRGKALVLYGPQGCGKSLLAQEVADNAGTSRIIESWLLTSQFEFGDVLGKHPRTLIIEGAPRSEHARHIVKRLLTNEQAICNRKGREPVMVRSPDLIICVEELPDWMPGDRRLDLVEVRRCKAVPA